MREAALREIPDKVNAFLRDVVEAVRPRFGGRISYASIPIEHIDWTPFDIVGVDAYRSRRNAAHYRAEIRQHLTHGKPVAVTEAGCCAYRGAADMGAAGWLVIGADCPPLTRARPQTQRLAASTLSPPLVLNAIAAAGAC
ncbi:hypothetical protein [Streptomyces sp. NBC_00212]|uniref:hypothetical protein n=1 Tax=Streptomyces sp. NBC_00212 TaxID=2975684 RepID=UPI00325146B2